MTYRNQILIIMDGREYKCQNVHKSFTTRFHNLLYYTVHTNIGTATRVIVRNNKSISAPRFL